jgi:hypothetical protein
MKPTRLIPIILCIGALIPFAQAEPSRTIPVNCNLPAPHLVPGAPRNPLARAIDNARPGDTLLVRGTCTEAVTIRRGPLTIDGAGTAVISGATVEMEGTEFSGMITVDGAQGITLRGLDIRESPAEGILAVRGAGVVIEDVSLVANHTGIRLSQSNLEFRDSHVHDSHGTALMAISGSTVVFIGHAELSGSGNAGLFLEGNAMGEIRGSQLLVEDNSLGVITSLHSTLAVLELDSAEGAALLARNNASIGLQFGQGMLMVAGEGRPVANVLIESSGNGGPGIVSVAGSQIASPFGAAQFVIENNPVGMVLLSDASVEIRGGLRLNDNLGPGLVASGAGVVTIRSWPDPDHPGPINDPSPSMIVGNAGPAVIADFGTRLDINDVEITGPVLCDPTVLSRTSLCS